MKRKIIVIRRKMIMVNYTSNEILKNFNGLGIFTRDNYTFVEYVNQLMKFQEETAKLLIGVENAHLVRMTEVVSRFETMARENNLYFDSKVTEGIRALKLISKEIAVAMAGKSGEDRVANTFQYVTRPDAKFYRNVYITDDIEETELDSVVLTKNGFIILEIKNAREDITIAPDGRILFNNSSCYHDISIGEKMDKKRRLLRARLEEEFACRGIEKEVKIDSLLVFSNPSGVRINVHDRFKKENYCLRGSLFNRIDGFETTVEYVDEEFIVMDEILRQIETEQKRFSITFNPEKVKRAFAEAFETLASMTEANEKTVEKNTTVKKMIPLVMLIKKFAGPAVAVSLLAVSEIALGVASRIYK